MKEGTIEKSGAAVDPEALEAIGRYARRPLKAEEVYTFSMVLCDNEVDRDHERFSIPALERLAQLFVGKTGIFDHDPKGANQTARIYGCRVERIEGRRTTVGEPYCTLRAEAYMVRSEKNADLILEIDAGIKKEVSVGCAVGRAVCSICGQDRSRDPCRHRPGQIYQGDGAERLCHTVLDEPADAYEWSFVAVPAQPAAGVTKGLAPEGEEPGDILKTWAAGGAGLSPLERQELARRLDRLEEEAARGRAWREKVYGEALRLGALAEPDLPRELLAKTLDPLGPEALEDWAAHFRRKAAGRLPLIQTAGEDAPRRAEENTPFKL